MVTSTMDLSMSWSSQRTIPVMPLNCPRTVAIIMCLTENPAAVCAGSICQVVVAAGAGTANAATRVAARASLDNDWSILFFLPNLKCSPRREILGCALSVIRCLWNDFFQRRCKTFQAGRVELFQNVQTGRGDAGSYHAAVIDLAFSGNQPAFFHAIEQSGHVRIVGNHAVANAFARQAAGFGSSQNAQHVVLGTG